LPSCRFAKRRPPAHRRAGGVVSHIIARIATISATMRTNQRKLLIATPPKIAKITSKMTSSQSSGTIPPS
jgi:hypothetical protein